MKNLTRICKFLAFAFVGLTTFQSQAQKPRLYSIEHGLASTQLTDLDIDNDNFLWVCTRGGLSRFDGQNFTTFTGESSNPCTLNTNHISCTHVDKEGRIWIGANDGLYLFEQETNRFQYFRIDDDPSHTVSISSIVDIDQYPGKLLLGTNGYGVFVFDKNELATDKILTKSYTSVFPDSYINLIINDDLGTHWIFTQKWMKILNPKDMRLIEPITTMSAAEQEKCEISTASLGPTSRIIYLGTVNHGLLLCHTRSYEVDQLDVPELKNRQITAIAAGQDSCMLIGTEGLGFWQLNVKAKTAERLHYPQCPVDIDHVKIKNITHDKQRNIWLSLYQKGVMVIPNSGKLFSCRPILATKGSEHNLSNVSCFAEGLDQTRYYGLDGAGILAQKPDGTRTHYSTETSTLGSNAIMSLETAPNGDIYVGTYGNGIYKIDAKGQLKRDPNLSLLEIRSIMDMAVSPDQQTLFIGCNGEGIFSYNLTTGELKQLINDEGTHWIISLYADDKQQLWFGTEGQLMRYSLTDGSTHRFKEIKHVRVFNICKDASNVMWFISDKGLLRYYDQDQTLHLIQTGQQAGETYSAMQMSDDGNFWLSSNRGITCYDPKHNKALRYNSPDIAEVGSFSIRASIRWSDQQFGFGGDNGMLTFNANEVENFDYQLTPIYFTRLWVNNQLTDYDPNLPKNENVLDAALWTASTLRLPLSSNSFSLGFTIQEYSTPIDINYAYRLNGYEKEWHEVQGLNQTLSYSSLPAGTYTLVVSAHQGNDLNSQPQTKELTIIIEAPWYQNLWIMIPLITLFGLSFIWMFWSIYLLRRKKK